MITNVGPVHVELLGSVEAIAAAKAEILAALPPDGDRRRAGRGRRAGAAPRARPRACCASAPAATSRPQATVAEGVTEALISTPSGAQLFHFPFTEAHNLTNALAAIAAGVALGAEPAEMADRAAEHRILQLPR